jgi:hypothetical protein
MADSVVRVEVFSADDARGRQIGARHRSTELLRERRDDIEAAVREAAEVLQESVAGVKDSTGWRMSTLEATFGLVLSAEAGVIVSRASAEVSLEVKVTIERA